MPDRSPALSSRFRPARAIALTIALAAALATAATAGAARAAPPVEERSIDALQADLTAGRTTSAALVAAYLDRIRRLDRAGPSLHAILALNPDALADARALDRERRAGHVRGPLHGIPLVIKDNVETKDRIATTAGSLALKDNVGGRDAPLVAQLRAAGAIVLGKSNLSEWANYRSEHSISGWSAIGGLTRNPYVLDRSACGSARAPLPRSPRTSPRPASAARPTARSRALRRSPRWSG